MADFVDDAVTDEIVAAKNSLVAQAGRAQDILDDWEGMTTLLNDAPSDGKIYGRVDGDWAEVNPVGGGAGGDMEASTYDPTGIEADVYDLANATGSLDNSKVTGFSVLVSNVDDKVDDAPVDGTPYVRQDEAWVSASSGSSGITIDDIYDLSPVYSWTDYGTTQAETYDNIPIGVHHRTATGSNTYGLPYNGDWIVECFQIAGQGIIVDGVYLGFKDRKLIKATLVRGDTSSRAGIYYDIVAEDVGTANNLIQTI